VSVSEPEILATAPGGKHPGRSAGASAASGGGATGWRRWLRSRLPEYGPPVYRRHSYLQVAVFVGLMAVIGAVFNGDSYRLGVMVTAFTYGIAALGLYFAYSLGGLFAFSQAAFMGLGAYTSAKLGDAYGYLTGLVGAIVVCFVVAVAVGFILRRARHLYFAVGALAVAELMGLAFANWTFLAGDQSGAVSGIVPIQIGNRIYLTSQDQFWIVLVLITLVLLASVLVERSPARRNALAGKQIPLVAQASGVPVYRIAIMLFGYGCVLAGIAGSLEAHSIGAITPDGFGVGLAIDLYLMLLLGGLRSIWGPIVGALFFTWLPELLRPVRSYETVIYSFLLLITIIVLPEGIVGSLGKATRGVIRRAQRH
jgi:branched-chain amino acid transport system permease protein